MLTIAAVAIVVSSATAAAGRAAGLPGGDPLQRLRVGTQGSAAQAASGDPSRRAGIIWLVLGSGAMLLVVISAVQAKRPPRLARVGAQSPEGGAQMRRKLAEEYAGVSEVEPEREEGFAELGQHVARVLATAREAAERIEADARREADLTLERAQAEADELLGAAQENAAKVEAEAARKRQAADEAAAELVARAEWQARDRARAAEERQQALDENVKRTEERLRKLVSGLREVARRLDVLVETDDRGDLDDELRREAARTTEIAAAPSAAEPDGQGG
jgi:hypothetical protein